MQEILYNNTDAKRVSDKTPYVSEFLANAIAGLADWVGLGNEVRTWFSYAPEWKDLQSIKTKLQNRINYLMSKNAIDLDELEKRLSNLESGGFYLSGLALKRYHDEVEKVRKERNAAKTTASKNDLSLAKAQADVDSLNAQPTDLAQIYEQINKANEISSKIGGTD